MPNAGRSPARWRQLTRARCRSSGRLVLRLHRADAMTGTDMTTRRRTLLWGLAMLLAAWPGPATAQDVLGEAGIKGAGSTFVYPVLSRWSREYRAWVARGG